MFPHTQHVENVVLLELKSEEQRRSEATESEERGLEETI
ncbi:hypothetical protein QE417_002407 [Mucilaginibacter terrae]|uniref:Uncharacterized protein n=1 Tax=Mucilaginibacter terrae TaxID=1955052 RepID=A0ABU3GU84_9SPHI|nr:hypothetical protein [Mucilaginibacter terrae]